MGADAGFHLDMCLTRASAAEGAVPYSGRIPVGLALPAAMFEAYMRLRPAAIVGVLLVAGALFPPAAPAALAMSTLNRPADPVVLAGADVPSFNGIAPGDLVAFRYAGGWQQIPVQVDERAVVNYGVIYGVAPTTVSHSQYTDAGTFTGADPNANIDSDDEIVFMAKDAGGPAGAVAEPAGVVGGSAVELTITDPLVVGAAGYVYLFEQAGALAPGAGQQYVTYAFNLLSGPYLTTYQRLDPPGGPNPENSTVTSAYYARHFGDRWLDDELRVTTGGSTGADILDRHKALFSPGACVRSEDTFDDAEGAFVVNKSGPVRALRSYIGANSGPLTQREHVFYEQRQDLRTSLRVHAITGVMDFFDYSPAATGMTYYNDLNPGGVTIDGAPETPAAGAIQWELVDGAQGAVVMSYSVSTNIAGFAYTTYYLDDSTPPVTQCTGDAFSYGSSGAWVNQAIPNTDPGLGATDFLDTQRTMYFLAPGQTSATAAALDAQTRAPLAFSAAVWSPVSDSDGDGLNDPLDNCPSVANASQADGDTDQLGDACEAVPYGTNPADADTDDDGCPDGREVRLLTFPPNRGGDRDPLDPWDFYDVTSSRSIGLSDTLLILTHFGHAPAGDALDDQLDRIAPLPAKPWRTAPSNDGVGLVDALVNLRSFGHDCSGAP